MRKFLHISICLSFIWSQFGCSTVPKSTLPAIIEDNATTTIEPVKPNRVDYQLFHKKIAELQGKIQKFHGQDSTFLSLQIRVKDLDSTQNEHEYKNYKTRKKAVIIGATIPAAVGLLLVTTASINDNHEEINGFRAILILSIATVGSFWGSLGGLLFSTGSDIKREHKEELAKQITVYNELDQSYKYAPLSDSLEMVR